MFPLLISYVIILKIKWENRYKKDIGNDCLVSVDGTDFRIYEQEPFWPGWFSHKFNGPGVRYELAVAIRTGDIVWINGPFPCGEWSDLRIFRSSLIDYLDDNERVEASTLR